MLSKVFLLFSFVALQSATAIQILAKSQIMMVTNGTRAIRTRLTVQCFPVDMDVLHNFQLQTSDGGVHNVTIECFAPQRHYRAFYTGVIPTDGELVTTGPVCASLSTENIALAEPDPIVHRTRTLLQTDTRPPFTGPSRFPGVNKEDLVRLCRQWAPSSRLPYDQFVNTCTNGGQNLDVLSNLRNAADELERKQRAMARGLSDLEGNNTVALELVGKGQAAFLNFTNLVNDRLGNQENITLLTEKNMNETIDYVTAENRLQLVEAAQYQLQIANVSGLMAAAVNRTEGNFERAFAGVGDAYAQQASALQQTSQVAMDDKALFFKQLRAIQIALADLLTEFDRIYRDEDMLAAHNAKAQAKLTQYAGTPNERGRTLKPFLKDAGVAPVADRYALPPNQASVPIAHDVLRYVTADAGGTPFGVVTQIKVACDAAWLVETDPLGPTWRDLLDWVGPVGCDTTWVSKSPRCKCAMTVSESRCRLSAQNATSWFQANDTTQVDTAAGCVDQITLSGYGLDGQAATDLDAVRGVFQAIGGRDLYGPTGANYQFIATYPMMQAMVPYAAVLRNITSITAFMNPSDVDQMPMNLVYFYFQTLSLSYRVRRDNLQVYRDLVFGRLPSGIRTEETLWERMETGGDTGRCTRGQFMAYSNEFLTVSNLMHDHDEVQVQVTVDGVSTKFQTSQLRNPYAYLLPARTNMVWAPSLFATRAWDTPEEETQPCAFKQGCQGTLVYPQMPSPDLFTLEAWEAANGGREFSPKHGSITAWMYEVAIDANASSPTYGRCLTYPTAAGGGWCIIRDHFQILVAGVFDDPQVPGTVIFVDRDASYTGTIEVPSGTYSRVVTSDCPRIGQIVAHIGNQISVPLSNAAEGEVIVRVTQSGSCQGVNEVPIPAGQTVTLMRPACMAAPPGQPDSLQIDVQGVGGTYKNCDGGIELIRANITVERERFRGAASLALTARLNEAVNNLTIVYLGHVANQITELLIDSAVQSMRSKINIGYAVSNITFDGYADIIDKARDIATRVAIISQNSIAAANNITDNSASNDARRAELGAIERDLATRMDSAVITLEETARAAKLQTALIKKLGAVSAQQIRDWVIAQNGFVQAIIDAVNHTISNCDPRNGNTTCFTNLGKIIADLGNLDPDRAKCAPSGIVAFFGGSATTSTAFAEMFGGCARGNLIGPLFVLASVAFGAGLFLMLFLYFLRPRYQRWRMRDRGTKSTTDTDNRELVEADRRLTKNLKEYEELLSKMKGNRAKSAKLELTTRYSDSSR